MMPRTCVAPSGRFVFGVHKPTYIVSNLRQGDNIQALGADRDFRPVHNCVNFPPGDIEERGTDIIYEIPNALPFRGVSYILKSWADAETADPMGISIPKPQACSFSNYIEEWGGGIELSEHRIDRMFRSLPDALKLALATNSTDPEDLRRLSEQCCEFVYDLETGRPVGLVFENDENGHSRANIADMHLFDALANNARLPDDYKTVMVLRPGAQGDSEIVGDWQGRGPGSHVFEYLRRNSYIPWGHYAANMADDAIRYQIDDLNLNDIIGMRHLYYQRTYVRVANELGLPLPTTRTFLSPETLEELRCKIGHTLNTDDKASRLRFNCTLWGWNFGFDYSPSGYRLHASHQQIHQQYAMVPGKMSSGGTGNPSGEPMDSFCCGDMIQEFTEEYRSATGRPFFDAYLEAIRSNQRLDGRRDRQDSLIVYEDDRVILFVPKAQTSQWELQLMTRGAVGNIIEADAHTRTALDRAILIAMKTLTALGARMITVIEYAKRFDNDDSDQRLLYAFLPRIPESPGAFSEAQMRWINGQYPEDFAVACRSKLPGDLKVAD
jgi:hypothetical protein